jgi:hypothetical protein
MQGQRGIIGRATFCTIGALLVFALAAQSASALAPTLSKVGASAVTETTANLQVEIDPKGKNTTYKIEYGPENCETSGTCTVVGQGNIAGGSSPVTRQALLEGLSPATLYHWRVVATNNEGEAKSGDRIIATRSGIFKGLPDNRAYEQASPTNKNGNDAMGDLATVKATASGGGITFSSAFGIPGGKGAESLPGYLASRGSSNWTTQGLLPPPSVGDRAVVIGWSPDYTEVFSNAFRLDAQREAALFVQSTAGGPPTQITPYTVNAQFIYSDQSKDGSVVLFESRSKLIPEALEGSPNLYAWDRATGNITLAGIYNDETSPPKGTIAGAYEWVAGINSLSLRFGGAFRGFYLRDENAISPDGSIYFTEAGTGQLYRRINPTKEQSPLNGQGKCEDPAKACTIHVSVSHKTDGKGPNGTDAAGTQPAAFQAASEDGTEVFFTSPEKLTNESNTGPEQAPAQIERDDLAGPPVEKPEFIPAQHAIGVATDTSHIYWVDPQLGTIGRADLDGNPTSVKQAFISPGTTQCKIETEEGGVETREEASHPRYVAVDSEYVYWTNTGCSDEFGPLKETGTIGRAKLDGTEVEPEFITGASNPQGIAVNSEYIYWANSGKAAGVRAIGRAPVAGVDVDQEFHEVHGNEWYPFGVALSSTHVYFSAEDRGNDLGFVGRFPLAGEPQEDRGIGKGHIRGVAVDAAHIYWASKSEDAIGRANLKVTEGIAEPDFIPLDGKPDGLAVDSAHLYWSTNGESPTNPGNDLYRYGPGEGQLQDLTPDDADENGAEVQGVVAVSGDGKHVYFAANGVLAAGAQQGNCEGPLGKADGHCSLYVWHDGAISFVSRLDAGASATDALNWAATPRDQFGTSSYFPKTSFLSADGQSLLFRSREKLTAYDSEGVPQFYRFMVGEGISCATCPPAGEAAGEGAKLSRIIFPGLGPVASVNAVSSRNFSASGNQFFFETPEALVPEDTNGQSGCPASGTGVQLFPACNDVYEWEAPGAANGTCTEASPAFSPINKGCIYLISTGKSAYPSLFADASEDGKDVFFFTRQSLVGQDKDELQDVYDARVGGGLTAQSPVASIPCESADACHGPVQTPPSEPSAGSGTFVGPGNPAPVHKKPKKTKKPKKHKQKKSKGKSRS